MSYCRPILAFIAALCLPVDLLDCFTNCRRLLSKTLQNGGGSLQDKLLPAILRRKQPPYDPLEKLYFKCISKHLFLLMVDGYFYVPFNRCLSRKRNTELISFIYIMATGNIIVELLMKNVLLWLYFLMKSKIRSNLCSIVQGSCC